MAGGDREGSGGRPSRRSAPRRAQPLAALGRRLRLALVVVAVVLGAVAAVVALVAGMGWAGFADALAWVFALASAPALGTAGVCHAVAMTRMQRPRRHDVAIALAGILAVVVVGVALALAAARPALATALLHATWPAWVGGVAFVAYLVHAWASRPLLPSEAHWASVVVLGGALRGRHVGPLLRLRVEEGAARWRALDDPTARLVVSGGQGADEPRSEAAAMAEHLVEACGIPASAIDLEDASTSTEENLRLTRDRVRAPEPWLVVTSEYHVPRTRVLLERLGIVGDAAGSWSSPVYRPGALARELAAALRSSRSTWLAVGSSTLVLVLVGIGRAAELVGSASVD